MNRGLIVAAVVLAGIGAGSLAVAIGNTTGSLTLMGAGLSVLGGAFMVWRYRRTRDLLDPLNLFCGSLTFYYGLHAIWLDHRPAVWRPFRSEWVDGAPGALLLLVVAFACLVGAHHVAKFKPRKLRGADRPIGTTAVIAVFTFGFAARLYGVQVGTFSRSTVDDASGFLIISTVSTTALIAYVVAVVQHYKYGTSKTLPAVMAGLLAVVALTTGRKEFIVEIGFGWLAARHYCYRPVALKWAALAVVVFAFVFTPLIQSGRDWQTLYGKSIAEQNDSMLSSTPQRAMDMLRDPSKMLTGWDTIHLRTNGVESTSLSVLKTGRDTHPYLYGEPWTAIPVTLIPRSVWPGKPTYDPTKDFSVRYALQRPNSYEGLAIAPTMLGDAYVNFGVVGACLVFALIGVLLKALTAWVKGPDPTLGVPLYTILMLKILLVELNLNTFGSFLLLNGLFVIATVWTLRTMTLRSKARRAVLRTA